MSYLSDSDEDEHNPTSSHLEPMIPSDNTNITIDARPPSSVRHKLYISHFLSTWNSRVFEFGAVLFLSTIFPGTLLPASVYALSRAAAVVLFSGVVGGLIDHGNRMHVVRLSIVGQRVATAISCLLLWFMVSTNDMSRWVSIVSLTIVSLLACIEKLNSVMNTISIERDWVVIIAQNDEHDLQELNSQMRRIDLFCKLIGPLAISLVDGFSTKLAILSILVMTCVSVGIEYFAIANVYKSIPDLQTQPTLAAPEVTTSPSTLSRVTHHCESLLTSLNFYINHPAFLPSFSLSLLYLTVFSFGGQLITYLVSIHMTSTSIGLLRTLSTCFELSATWLAPKVMDHIGPIRSGIWFLNWQVAMVGLALGMLWFDTGVVTVVGLLVGVILSRVGLWGFDLSAQIIVQESVQPHHRGSFSAIEASMQNVFELLSFASTIIFPRPGDFRYPARISAAATVVAGVLYALFVRRRRGHLFHASKCVKGRTKEGERRRDREEGEEWVMLREAEDGSIVEGGEAEVVNETGR